MTETANLNLPLMEPAQSQPHAIYNAAMAILDALNFGATMTVIGEQGSPTFVATNISTLVFNGCTVELLAAGIVSVTPSGGQVLLQLNLSDLTTTISAGTSRAYLRSPRAFTITAVRASLLTASSSGVVTVDINKNGATILSTKLTIDANEKTSTTAATPPVISDANIADDDELTFDIDGGGTGAAGLIVSIIGSPA